MFNINLSNLRKTVKVIIFRVKLKLHRDTYFNFEINLFFMDYVQIQLCYIVIT